GSQVIIAAPGKFFGFDLKAANARGCAQRVQPSWNHFLADAVAGDDGYAMFVHGSVKGTEGRRDGGTEGQRGPEIYGRYDLRVPLSLRLSVVYFRTILSLSCFCLAARAFCFALGIASGSRHLLASRNSLSLTISPGV